MKCCLTSCLLLILTTSLLYAQVPSQDIQFTNFTSVHGLSQNRVNCAIQDRKGFLWFGTENGLNRYDGYQFKVYRNELNNKNSLGNNYIMTLLEDRQGYIWIGTFGGGLNRFNPDTEEFTRYVHSRKGVEIWSLCEDNEGKIWIGSPNSYFSYFDPRQQKIKEVKQRIKSHLPRVHAIVNDQNKGLWLGTGLGLAYFDRQTKTYTKHFFINPENVQEFGAQDAIYKIFCDRINPDILWLGTFKAGLVKFDTHTKQIIGRWAPSNTSLKSPSVWSFHQDKKGGHWVGTLKGFYKFDPQTEKFTLFSPDPQNPRKISGNNIQYIFEDKTGAIWLCSYNRGISAFNPYLKNFSHYELLDKNISHISTFCEDQEGNIWFGAKGGSVGLARLHRRSNTIKTFVHDPHNIHSIPINDVNILLTDISDGCIWVGTSDEGLSRYDSKTGIFERLPWHPSIVRIGAMYQDKHHPEEIWIGTRGGGLFKFDKKTKKYTDYNNLSNTTLSQRTVIVITKDYRGNLWLATRGGLNHLDFQRKVFTHYRHSSDDQNSISGDYVSALYIDQQNILWVGTHDGLNKLDLKEVYQGQVKFQHYTPKQGLPNSIVHKIIEDAQGFLWLSTSKGLSRFDRKQEIFKNFDAQDGLQSNEFCTNSGLLAKDGAILMGGINGFNMFYPDEIRENLYAPPVVFTHFQVTYSSASAQKKNRLSCPIWATDTVQLSYAHQTISFEFAGLSYVLPQKNKYAVLMENFDQNWHNTGHKHTITYTRLPVGTYKLRVKAVNNDGIWSKKEANLTIVVNPAWWQSKWFGVSLACLITSLLVVGYYLRQRWIKTQQKFSKEPLPTLLFTPLPTINPKEKNAIAAPRMSVRNAFKNQEEIEVLKQKLHEVIIHKELYKEEVISLAKIAQEMDTTDKKLSELFNKELATNFYDYINECKVRAFKKRVENGDAQRLTLIALAYESGFNSKSSFNRIFKKHTGLTPTQFKKNIENI